MQIFRKIRETAEKTGLHFARRVGILPDSSINPRVYLVLTWSSLFDSKWYLATYPDVAEAGRDPVVHYIEYGAKEGRNPSPRFDTGFYLRTYPDVASSAVNPLYHYIVEGRAEGRSMNEIVLMQRALKDSPLFDREWYLAEYPDIAATGKDPLEHYIEFGAGEGRNPSPWFDTTYYINDHPEIHFSGNPLYHYTVFGRQNGSRIAPVFDGASSRAWVEQLLQDPACERVRQRQELVSVILPTRDRAAVLPNAIASVLAQTYKNWELIIVDDHSSDGTDAMLAARYRDSRIKVIKSQGSGVSAARNTGLQAAGGYWIAYLDSDNTWTADYLELMLCELERAGSDCAYSISKIIRTDSPIVLYLRNSLNYETLKFFNYIDLNVFIHKKDLAGRLGDFDVTLRRMVDWDLILRYVRSSSCSFANFIGCNYNNNSSPDRISTREDRAYLNVVRNKHLIDWDAIMAALPQRNPDLVSVIICVYGQIDLTERCLTSLFTHEAGTDFEVILVDNGNTPDITARLESWSSRHPSIRLIRNIENFNFALGNNVGFAASQGSRVVFLNSDTEVSPEWLRTLVRPLDRPEIMGTQPKLLYPDGSIQCAGLVFSGHSPMAYPIYVKQAGDLFPTSRSRDYAAVTAACMALRAGDFAAMRGFDPVYVNGQEDVDLCLRIGAGKAVFRYVADSIVIHHEGQSPGRWNKIEYNRSVFYGRWKDLVQADDSGYYQADGIIAGEYLPDNTDWVEAGYAVWKPGLVNVAPYTSTFSKGLEGKVIAIKIPCPRPAIRDHWGDYHFGVALAAACMRKGVRARIDFLESWSTAGQVGDLNLVLRGLSRFKPDPDTRNVIWMISHPDKVSGQELEEYDHVFIASGFWAARVAESCGVPVEALLQCTDACRFSPFLYDERVRTDTLFVANSRKVMRPIVRQAIEQNLELEIFGEMWEGLAPERWVKRNKIENVDLPGYYASAGVVLNDHWDSMREAGFISNRIFDALACGAPVVTDSVPDFPADLAGGCHFFDQTRSLSEVISAARRDPAAINEQAFSLAEHVRKNHSFDDRVRRILEVFCAG